MPDWTYIDTDTTNAGTTWDTASYRQFYEGVHAAQCEREQRMWEGEVRAIREAEERCFQEMKEREEDKKKYPLFFLKEGIV